MGRKKLKSKQSTRGESDSCLSLSMHNFLIRIAIASGILTQIISNKCC